MIYYKATGDNVFFGMSFVKNELLTEKELLKFVNNQLKEGAGFSILKNFINREFLKISWPKNKTCFVFGARFQTENKIF